MSKVSKSHRSDEIGELAVLQRLRLGAWGDLFDIQPHGIKDKTPDTDGFIRLRELFLEPVGLTIGKNLNKAFFYQLKSMSRSGKTFNCNSELLEYLLTTNLPTILFVVDIRSQPPLIYWYHLSQTEVNMLGLTEAGPYSPTPFRMRPLQTGTGAQALTDEDVKKFYDYLNGSGVRDELIDTPAPIRRSALHLKNILAQICAVFYLVDEIPEAEYKAKLSKALCLDESVFVYLVGILIDNGQLIKLRGLILTNQPKEKHPLGDRTANILLASELRGLDHEALLSAFDSQNEQEKILERLSTTGHSKAMEIITDQMDNILEQLNEE